MKPENRMRQSEIEDPPDRTDEDDLAQGNLPNFRMRLVPSLLLWFICLPTLLISSGILVFWLYTQIRYGWLAPDPRRMHALIHTFLSPPILAYSIVSIPGTLCGIMAAIAWSRKNWRQAIKLTVSFILLMVFAGYLGGER